MVFDSSIGDIHYRKVGQGPHLSFLHGFCESSHMWDALSAQLSQHYSCLLIDLPGFGESPLLQDCSIAEMAQAVLELIAQEAPEGTVLFGHSMGGYVAIEAYAQQAHYIRGIGMIHSTVLADTEEKRASRQKVIDFLQEQPATAFLKQFYPQLVADNNLERHRETLWDLVKTTTSAAIQNGSRAMMNRRDHTGTLTAATIPILFLTGDSDKFFDTESIYQQASLCQRAQVTVLSDVGHLSPVEDEKLCLDAVIEFLDWVLIEDVEAQDI